MLIILKKIKNLKQKGRISFGLISNVVFLELRSKLCKTRTFSYQVT